MKAHSSLIVAVAVLLGLGGPLCDAACAAPAQPAAQHAVPPCHAPAPEAPAVPAEAPSREDCAAACDDPLVAQAPLSPDLEIRAFGPALVALPAPVARPASGAACLRPGRLPPPDLLLRKSTLNL